MNIPTPPKQFSNTVKAEMCCLVLREIAVETRGKELSVVSYPLEQLKMKSKGKRG
jgi:hypothetical protein